MPYTDTLVIDFKNKILYNWTGEKTDFYNKYVTETETGYNISYNIISYASSIPRRVVVVKLFS